MTFFLSIVMVITSILFQGLSMAQLVADKQPYPPISYPRNASLDFESLNAHENGGVTLTFSVKGLDIHPSTIRVYFSTKGMTDHPEIQQSYTQLIREAKKLLIHAFQQQSVKTIEK